MASVSSKLTGVAIAVTLAACAPPGAGTRGVTSAPTLGAPAAADKGSVVARSGDPAFVALARLWLRQDRMAAPRAELQAKLAELCRGGHPLACDAPIWVARDDRIDFARVRASAAPGCAQGHGAACLLEAWALSQVGAFPGRPHRHGADPRRAAALLAWLCAADDASGCADLGELRWAGVGVARDERRARELFSRACEGGVVVACSEFATSFLSGRDIPMELTRGVALLRKACEAGNHDACGGLGLHELFGVGTAQDAGSGAAFLADACEAGSYLWCGVLGVHLSMTRRPGDDAGLRDAAERVSEACRLGAPMACSDLGILEREGRGVARNVASAVARFQDACDVGAVGGCTELGAAYRDGVGVPRDAARARVIFAEACLDGGLGSCRSLLEAHGGDPSAPDVEDAYERLARGCGQQHRVACWLREQVCRAGRQRACGPAAPTP